MRSRILQFRLAGIFVILILASSILFSQTYYSIASGAWTDGLVWSMSADDPNPCNCYPPDMLDNENVMIRHEITTDHAISVDDGHMLMIEAGCTFETDNAVNVYGGDIMAYGQMIAEELYIHSGARVELQSGPIVNETFWVEGEINLNFPTFDTLSLNDGNLMLEPDAEMTVKNACLDIRDGNMELYGKVEVDNCFIDVRDGNLIIFDTMNVEGACITAYDGNVEVKSGGHFLGSGGVRVLDGNAINAGEWSNDIKWCADDGNGDGFSTENSENCAAVDVICSQVVLSIDFGNVWLVPRDETIVINWIAYNESELAYYQVERCVPGRNFEMIGVVEAFAGLTNETHNMFIDAEPVEGVIHYRIVAIDKLGGFNYSKIVSTHYVEGDKRVLNVYPNPVRHQLLTIEVLPTTPGKEIQIEIFASHGQRMKSIYNVDQHTTIFEVDVTNWPSGIYLVQMYKGAKQWNTRVLVTH